MSTINIAKNYRQYTSEELREYGYAGLLECNGYDLSDFIERIFQGFDEIVEKRVEAALSNHGDLESELEDARDEVRRAIRILEEI